MTKELEEGFQCAFDLWLRLRHDCNRIPKGTCAWAVATIIADWGEHSKLVVGEPHGSVSLTDGALQFVCKQGKCAFLNSPLKLGVQERAHIGNVDVITDFLIEG